jgi:uncharacterized RDD family membrane protein YckC
MICRNHVDVTTGLRRCSRCGVPFCSDCLVDIGGAPYCATCTTEKLLDVRSGVDRTMLDYAGIGRRFAAVFIDGLITGIPTMIIVMVVVFGIIARGGKEPQISGWMNLWFIIPSFIALAYEAILLQRLGQTVGKMAMKLKVVRPDGTPISGGQAWGRALSRTLLGFLYIVDYIPAFFTTERTTLHDLIARTRVVVWA